MYVKNLIFFYENQHFFSYHFDCNINIEENETQPQNREAFFAAYFKNGIYAIDKYCKQLEPKLWQKVAEIFKNKLNNIAK